VSDEGIEGLVILNRLRSIHIERDPASESAHLVCGAGVIFARAAQYSARHGYTGMEWGIAIPGTIGGGVVNNAGAHWSDVARSLEDADVVDGGGQRRRLTPQDLVYHYRQSALKVAHARQSSMVVIGARFRIETADPEAALARIDELRRHRMQTQPIKEASAGSTFKNPPGQHAGALIDQAGLKGRQIGGAQIAPLHANFILNRGGASAEHVVALIRLAQSTVSERFGVALEPEVQFVGRWQEEPVVGSPVADHRTGGPAAT
jgi:UDP-N-acetylmuramate dehydrogenase